MDIVPLGQHPDVQGLDLRAWASALFPWQVLYLMSLGFSPASTASVAVASTCGSTLGFIIGGAVGDWTARRWPNVARPLANQISLALTIPLVFLVLKGMPQSAAHATGWPGSADSWAWVGNPFIDVKSDHTSRCKRLCGLRVFHSLTSKHCCNIVCLISCLGSQAQYGRRLYDHTLAEGRHNTPFSFKTCVWAPCFVCSSLRLDSHQRIYSAKWWFESGPAAWTVDVCAWANDSCV